MVSAGVTEFLILLAILFGGGMISAWIMHKIHLLTIISFILIDIVAGPFGLDGWQATRKSMLKTSLEFKYDAL